MTRASSPVNNGKAKIALGDDTALTLSQKGRGNPFDPANYGEIVKPRSEEHTSELQSLMRISYAVFCLKKKKRTKKNTLTLMNTRENRQAITETKVQINYDHTRL